MIISVDFSAFQKSLKDFKSIVVKSPLAKGEDSKDLGVLITADDAAGRISLEVVVKGFYLSATIPGEIKDPGAVVVRLESIITLKANLGEATLSASDADKVLKIKSGRFKADIPISHDVDMIASQRPEKLKTTHSLHSSKIMNAVKCVDLAVAKDEAVFSKFLLDGTGMTAWSNSPSIAALFKNTKASFDETLTVVFPTAFLSAYLSKVSGKVQIAVDETVFQLTSDDIDASHPLREADIFDIKSLIEDLASSDEKLLVFSSRLDDALSAIESIKGFAPEDLRIIVKVDPKKNTFNCKANSPSGEGENAFAILDPEGKASKGIEFHLNVESVLSTLTVIQTLGFEDIVWNCFEDRILLQTKDGSVSYVCAHMEG